MHELRLFAPGGLLLSQPLLQEMRKLLSFVIVGGGPTGVEVAAELYDMVESDLSKIYPNLVKEAVISVIELQDHVLSTCEESIDAQQASFCMFRGCAWACAWLLRCQLPISSSWSWTL